MSLTSKVQIFLKEISHTHIRGKKSIGSDFQVLTKFGTLNPSTLRITVPRDTTKRNVSFQVYSTSHLWKPDGAKPSINLPLEVTVRELDKKMPDESTGKKDWNIQLNNFPFAGISYKPQQIQIAIQVLERPWIPPVLSLIG